MAGIRIVLNRAAISRILKSEVVGTLEAMGRDIADAAGEGHEVETFIGRNRARVTVRTATFDAMAREATDRNLSRAIDAGRR